MVVKLCQKGEIEMKKITGSLFAIFATLISNVKAEADYVVVNNPVFDYATFAYSDAMSTNGVMEYAQSTAQRFTLDASHNLSTLKWWGGMNNFFSGGYDNLRGFEVNIWNEDQTQVVLSTTVLNGQYTRTGLPAYNQFGGQVSMFFMPITGAIDAGTYHMNIGALYNETAPLKDQWVWTTGFDSIEDPESLSVSTNYTPGGWGTWYNGLPGVGTGIIGGAFVMTAPAPGAIALIGLAGLIGCRRRRR